MKNKIPKLLIFGFLSFIAFAINAFAAITISPTGQSYTVSSDFGDKTLTRTIKTFKTIDNDSAFHVLPDKLMPGDAGAASLYDCENGGYASSSEIAIIQSGKKNGYNDMEIQIALYCQATTGTSAKSDDEFYQTICSRYVAGEDVIGNGLMQINDPSGYFLRGLQLYKSGASTTYYEATTGFTGITLEFDCSSGKCYYPNQTDKVLLSSIEGLNIPSNAKILSVTEEGADSIDVSYGSRTVGTVSFSVVATPNKSICPTCAYVQIIVEYESSDVLSQPALCAPTAAAGSGVNITNSSNMLVYKTTGSIKKIFTIYSGSGNTENNTDTYNSVFYPHSVIVDYENNDVVLANSITTIPNAKTTCGINTIAPGGSLKATSNNAISDDEEDPFKDISTDYSKITTGTACDGSSYKVSSDEVSGNVDTIINNQYCNIYCKEDIKIVVPSKARAASNDTEKIFSGRYFTLPDLKVEGRKTCVADIDIEQFFYDVYGNKINIGDVLSGKTSTRDLLNSGGGSNYKYMNATNWGTALETAYIGMINKTYIDEIPCRRYFGFSCSGYGVPLCPGKKVDVGGGKCCDVKVIFNEKIYSNCTSKIPKSYADSITALYSVLMFKHYEIVVPTAKYDPGTGVTIEEQDDNGNISYTDIYNSFNATNAQFVRYGIPKTVNSTNTKVEFVELPPTEYKTNSDNNEKTCYPLDEPSQPDGAVSWECLCHTQSLEEAMLACGLKATGDQVGSAAAAVKHHIAVYDAMRDANYAATKKSIEDILACSEAYKYVVYNIKTPEVTFNYCDDYKIDYKFTGGLNENVKVEYCKNGATSIDFACIGEGQTQEAPIDEIDFSKFNRQISYYDCGDSYCNSTTIKTITIPINKSVKFEYTASYRANTDTTYYSIVPSGVVRTKPTNTNSILLGEDGKVYPLSIGQVGNKACNYSFTFNTIGETHYENCFPELEKPMVCSFVLYNEIVNPGSDDTSKGLMYFYRTIDLDDIFPNSNNDYSGKNLAIFREVGSNWSSEKGVDTQKEVEKTGEDVYLEENLEYSYTLTPRQMARIRAYNNAQEKRGVGYADFNLTCDSKGQGCRSSFLDGALIGCENKRCFTDNLNSSPAGRDASFKNYANSTSWK